VINDHDVGLQPSPASPAVSGRRVGFRLGRLEVYNWGTFHDRVWGLDLHGDNALLTGEIGSGKSTLVDAITTLLVPPQKITYNKAAGAEARERNLRTYVLGYYKSERGDSGLPARPVALRDPSSYAVLLGCFASEELAQRVTLAQVFWFKDPQGQPARFYVVADAELSIAEHFAHFGAGIGDLRKRLRGLPRVELYESFPPYGSAYRRRFGIENEQALDLFYQTVSLKSVGNLTEFVREQMLEAFPVEPRVEALILHFDDLDGAHGAVLRAKDQIERLTPLVADCEEHAGLSAQVETLRGCREALRPWFAHRKAGLLEQRLAHLDEERARLAARAASLVEQRDRQRAERDCVRQAIAAHGGDRIEKIKQAIAADQAEKEERARRSERYDRLAREVGLDGARDADGFLANRRALQAEQDTTESGLAGVQHALTEANVELRQ